MSNDTPIRVKYWHTYIKEHPEFTGCIIDKDKDIGWFKNGEHHRENGPAIEYAYGSKVWYVNGELHRTDGPAIEHANGSKEWWLNGKYHRENAPAIEYADGSKEWWLNGEILTEQQHRLAVRHLKLKLLDTVQ